MTVPTPARASFGSSVTSYPLMNTCPDVGRIRFVIIFRVVLLPAPLGPRSPVKLLRAIPSDRSSTAVNRPYSLRRHTSSMGFLSILSPVLSFIMKYLMINIKSYMSFIKYGNMYDFSGLISWKPTGS